MKPEETYKKLFSHTYAHEPRTAVGSVVIARIHRARLTRARIHASFHSFIVLATIISLVPAAQHLATTASDSGFLDFAALGLSDGVSVLGSWKAFLFTLIESAPVLETGIVLGLIVLAAYSLRQTARYITTLNTKQVSTFIPA